MPVLYKHSDENLYNTIKDRNLQSQWFLLETVVEYSGRQKNFKYTPDILFSLHHSSACFLDDTPGRIKTRHNHIANSDHTPPDPTKVASFLNEFFKYLNEYKTKKDEPFDWHLPAYALWRLTWIHPFHECNGRTARAFCFLIFCISRGRWIKGKQGIHELINEQLDGYYLGLRRADQAYKDGVIDVSYLEEYLRRLLYMQLKTG